MRKKEILIISGIILLALSLAFAPYIKNFFISKNEEAKEQIKREDKTVDVTFKGELIVDEITFTIKYGDTLAPVLSKLIKYTNDYSIIDIDRNKKIYDDTTIYIKSSDIGPTPNIEIDGLININDATKLELMTIKGIKEKRAIKIIEYREKKKITSFEELQKIIGVSDEIIREIKDKATL